MYRACIAVVDASRARLFTFERTSEVQGLREELVEQRDLVNPSRRLPPSEIFTETRPPLGRSGNLQYGTDDHRDEHVDQLDIVFSRAVVDELEDLLRSAPAQRLIICASPGMLGKLRKAGHWTDLAVDEVPRDLVKLSPDQLHDHLVSYGLLPTPAPRHA
jgi:protein required for attachment to host cells